MTKGVLIKQLALFLFAFLFSLNGVLCQDSKFLLVGPSIGINQSWRTYDKPITCFQPKADAIYGFEGGVNVFYKSKGKLGFLADLGLLHTKSSITTKDYFSTASEIDVKEASKWMTLGGNIIFFPSQRSKILPFLGTGLYMAYLNYSDVSVTYRHSNREEETTLDRNLEKFRTSRNLFVKLVGGITINQFDKHRILLLATYSRTLQEFARERPPFVLPDYLVADYAINSLTIKLMMAL